MDSVRERVSAIDSVWEGASQFGHAEAYWVNGVEVGDIEGQGVFEVRLTKPIIREMRPMLKANDAVRLRPSASDWLEVVIDSQDDADLAVSLFARAVAAHRPADGRTDRLPPDDRSLRRRRRLH
jgi:hypothetical protein